MDQVAQHSILQQRKVSGIMVSLFASQVHHLWAEFKQIA